MTLDRQTLALLALVEADRAQKCAAIEADARARCAALLLQAHADARAKMRAAFTEERAHSGLRIAAAQATLQTRLRLALQHRSATFLAAGWRRLSRALDARWADAGARASWVDAIVGEAQGALPKAELHIAHPPAWAAAERASVTAQITREFGHAPTLAADPAITAGLRITAGANVIDGTRDGLSSDRAEIGARLLHQLERASATEPA
jgi:hypothetical protein